MKSLAIIAALAASALPATSAQRSAPFRLVVLSGNSRTGLNGTVITALHAGAAIEALVPSGHESDAPEPHTTFYHNVTEGASSIDTPGILAYDWKYDNDPIMVESSPMSFETSLTSCLAVAYFGPPGHSFTQVSFDECGEMYIGTIFDDRVDPRNLEVPPMELIKVQSWWVCVTEARYQYHQLVWVAGMDIAPNNPTCKKVQVKRVFI